MDQDGWIPVTSSNVAAIRYEMRSMMLSVLFKNGGVYHYPGITQARFVDLMHAPSKGKWVWQHLRSVGYPFTRD